MRSLPTILLFSVALLLLAAAPAAGVVAMPYLSLPEEAVAILNAGPDPVDLTGWTLTDEGVTDTYTFPSFTLASWEMVRVHAGRGTNSATDLYWGRGPGDAAVWNNDGDIVTLRDASGTRIADSRGFILGAPTLAPTPVPTLPLVTMVRLPGYPPVSPIPTPYITTPPTGVASYVPITSPYPTTIRTLPSGPTTVPTTLPIPRPPLIAPLPTGSSLPVLLPTVAPASPLGISGPIAPTLRSSVGFGKRYAVGNPGSFLGTRFSTGTAPTGSSGRRAVTTTDTVLKPGSRAYGTTPPASGSFVRWYPAARWAAGIE